MTIQSQADTFLSQKRIAVVGVSRKGGTGNEILKALRKRGFEVVPVNPNASEVHGETCYPSVGAIDGGVGAAVIATRPEVVEAVVRDCVDAGVSHVWMHYNALFGVKNSSVSEAAADYGRDLEMTLMLDTGDGLYVPYVESFEVGMHLDAVARRSERISIAGNNGRV